MYQLSGKSLINYEVIPWLARDGAIFSEEYEMRHCEQKEEDILSGRQSFELNLMIY
jgi:hypothetical protein